jgi:hypothetical protein
MWRRVLLSACTGLGVVTVLYASSCGGQIYGNPLGFLDDAGTYHSPDGAVLFGPGSSCVGYDPAKFAQLEPLPACEGDDFCKSWLAATVPPGYPFGAPKCSKDSVQPTNDTPSVCGAYWRVASTSTYSLNPIYCTPGPSGDAFCRAFLNQFVVGGGQAGALCVHQCNYLDPEPGTESPYCASDGPNFYACVAEDFETCSASAVSGPQALQRYELCVHRGDGGYADLEPPCAVPPPVPISDAGDDQAQTTDAGEEP